MSLASGVLDWVEAQASRAAGSLGWRDSLRSPLTSANFRLVRLSMATTMLPGESVGSQELLDRGKKDGAVDSAVDHTGRAERLSCSDAGRQRRSRTSSWPWGTLAISSWPRARWAVAPCHVGGRPLCADEDEAG